MNFLRPSPEAPAPTQTAVIALVPEAESLVGNYRQRLDASAVWGVPAHVTVLLPFLAPHEVDEQVIATLTAAVSVPAFDCRFTQARWFGHDVLYLAPEPSESFRELTAAVWRAFPQHPPYGSRLRRRHPTPDGRGPTTGRPTHPPGRRANGAARPPVDRPYRQAVLVAGTQAPASWRVIQRLSLGAAVSSAGT